MITVREFNTVAGSNRVYHPSLGGARILGVKRDGVGLTAVSIGLQVNREFSYGFSSIYVDPANTFVQGEKIWVLYET